MAGMNLIELTPDIFNFFGERKYTFATLNKGIFNGLRLPNATEQFHSICKNVLNGNVNINVTTLKLCLFQMLLNQPDSVNNELVNVFNEFTTEIGNEINARVIEETFTIGFFLEKYQRIYNVGQTLRKLLEEFDKNVVVSSSKNYSHINLIRSYTVYRNIVARQYFHKDGDIYLYELVCKALNATKNSNDMIKIFKIYRYYDKLSYTVKEHECLFDRSLNDKFSLGENGADSQLIFNLFEDMASEIYKISADINNNTAAEDNIKNHNLDKIRDTVTMLEKISDKYNFLVEYYNNLTVRLLSGKSCGLVEKEILKIVPYKSDPELYHRMRFQITDIMESLKMDALFKKVKINKTEKYADFDLTTFKRDACNFKILRSYAWDIKDGNSYNVPIELSPYIDFFNKCFNNIHSDRKLTYNHEASTGIIKLTLNNKQYYLHLTLPQIYIVLELNHHGALSATELSKVLGDVPLNSLANSLNSLMFIDLLKRDSGALNDPTIPFKINPNWAPLDDKISLVQRSKPSVHAQVQLPKTNAQLYITLVNYIRESSREGNGITLSDLLKKCEASVDRQEVNILLDKIVSSGHVEFLNDKYKYVGVKMIDDDSTDDFESETENGGDETVEDDATDIEQKINMDVSIE